MRIFLLLLLAGTACLPGQPAPKPEPDVLIFSNGEKLIGHLVRASGANVVFKSDMVGEITVAWSKVNELHAAQPFAVVPKNVRLNRREAAAQIKQGPVSVAGPNLTVAPAAAPPQTVPVADTAQLIDTPTFERTVLHNPGFFEDWRGAVTAGAALVEGTQQSRTFTGGIHLIRAIPSENWMDARNRTSLNFSVATGFLRQPNTPNVKTNILHADLERDQYFPSSRVYAFGQMAFDHNYSQGLDLQQNYGGGIGWTVIKRANETLDVKTSVSYVREAFTTPGLDENLVGSSFVEVFSRHFAHGVTFLEQLAAMPTWNDTSASAASGSASLNIPVYKRLTFTTAVSDNFLNNPPPGFKKNSFQFTTGLTYTLR
jgi:hypothetical protein